LRRSTSVWLRSSDRLFNFEVVQSWWSNLYYIIVVTARTVSDC
jgi:hypothetical protein